MTFLLLLLGVNTAWGQDFNQVYAFVADGHYMAHCGDIAISSAQAVSDPTAFNPNTCLWATTTATDNSLLHAYGTDSHNGGYYLKESHEGENTFYNLVVNTTSLRYFQTASTEPKALAPTLTGNTTDANPAHYLRYDATNGWILSENTNASTQPTVKAVTSITQYTMDPVFLINCPDEITYSSGASPTLSASASTKAYIHTVFNNTENHYWYDDADHDAAPGDNTLTITSPTWSLASADLEYASIDHSTGVITVKKQLTTPVTLTLSCRATVGESTMSTTKTITLQGGDYQIERMKYAIVTSATIATNTTTAPTAIDYVGAYQYSLSGIVEETYEIRTIDNVAHYWYDGSDHGTAPNSAAWGEVSGLTKTWSLESAVVGFEKYASVNAATGLLSVQDLPTTNVALTLKCTITKAGTELTPQVVSQTITLNPETAIVSPTITTAEVTEAESTVTKATITMTDARPTVYYTTGPTETLTPEPTISSLSMEYEDPFTIDDDVACIKACAANVFGEHTAYSDVTTYNILSFTNSTINVGTETVTAAPLVYSCDLETPSGMTAYTVSRVSPIDHTAMLTPLVYIPEGVPVLLLDKNTEKKMGRQVGFPLTPINVSSNDITPITDGQKSGNLLRVTDKKMTVDNAQVYMYYNGEFVLTLSGEMKAGRYYLSNPNYDPTAVPQSGGGGNARLHFVIANTTDIDDVRWKKEEGRSDSWYTLDGRRLSGNPVKKGVYINDGRKIVTK